MDGSVSVCSRRDLRRGGHRGRLVAHDANRLSLYFTWDDPYAGERRTCTSSWILGGSFVCPCGIACAPQAPRTLCSKQLQPRLLRRWDSCADACSCPWPQRVKCCMPTLHRARCPNNRRRQRRPHPGQPRRAAHGEHNHSQEDGHVPLHTGLQEGPDGMSSCSSWLPAVSRAGRRRQTGGSQRARLAETRVRIQRRQQRAAPAMQHAAWPSSSVRAGRTGSAAKQGL